MKTHKITLKLADVEIHTEAGEEQEALLRRAAELVDREMRVQAANYPRQTRDEIWALSALMMAREALSCKERLEASQRDVKETNGMLEAYLNRI